MLLVDTHAWVDFFSASPRANNIRKIFEESTLYTSILSIAEYRLWGLRNNVGTDKDLRFIEENSTLVNIDKEISLLAAAIKFNSKEKNIGIIDCLIYATALTFDLKVLTGDHHFKAFKNTIMLE